jgi:hypothetical protein
VRDTNDTKFSVVNSGKGRSLGEKLCDAQRRFVATLLENAASTLERVVRGSSTHERVALWYWRDALSRAPGGCSFPPIAIPRTIVAATVAVAAAAAAAAAAAVAATTRRTGTAAVAATTRRTATVAAAEAATLTAVNFAWCTAVVSTLGDEDQLLDATGSIPWYVVELRTRV